MATQAVSLPNATHLRASSSPRGQTAWGTRSPLLQHRKLTVLLATPVAHTLSPRLGGAAGRAPGAHSTHAGSTQGPSPGWTLCCREGAGLNHPGVSHPADTPACSTQVCVFFGGGREGRRHVALGASPCPGPGAGMQGDGVSPSGPPPLTLAALDLILSWALEQGPQRREPVPLPMS